MKKIAVTAAVFLLAAVCSVGAVIALIQPEALSVRPLRRLRPVLWWDALQEAATVSTTCPSRMACTR